MRPGYVHALTATLLVLSGCAAQQVEDEFRNAVPNAEELTIEVPGESEGVAGAATEALIGERAHLYQITRDTSQRVNGGLRNVLRLIRSIADHPPTDARGDFAKWGPWTEPLSPLSYVFFVHRVGEGHYRYVLKAKPKNAGADAFVDIVAGESETGPAGYSRRGAIGLDFDAAHALDPNEHPQVGRIAARYDTAAEPRMVEAAFENVDNRDNHGLTDALYRYTEARDRSGTFEFAARSDTDDAGPAPEHWLMTSRWNVTGAGRGDAIISQGDLGGLVIRASECWDESFGRSFYEDSHTINPTEGEPATCAYGEPLWADR